MLKNGKAVKAPMSPNKPSSADKKFGGLFHRKKTVRRPPGTNKDGNFRSFSDGVTRSNSILSNNADMSSLVNGHGSSPTFSEDSSTFAVAVNPRLFNRSFSYSQGSHPVVDSISKYHRPQPLDLKLDNVDIASNNTVNEKMTLNNDGSEYMTAVYTFIGLQPTDLSFNVGDKIKVIRKVEDDWWEGETVDGRTGEFPGNYVK